MLSTSSKIACGYIVLIALLFGVIGYIYRQMSLMTDSPYTEEQINSRRHTTHHLISKLYEAEIIGQTLHLGKLREYPRYKRAMKEIVLTIDSLQAQLTDSLQLLRLDTVRTLIRSKERNMMLVLESLRQNPADELYKQQLDSLIAQQDSILHSATHLKRKVITHRNTYTIHHKKKTFFKRVKDVFAPGKSDSTLVNNLITEEFTDTVDEVSNPIDTLATMLTNIHNKVFQTRQEQLRTLSNRTNNLHYAGSKLSKRVNQLLESIEQDERNAAHEKLMQEQNIRTQAAWTMGIIASAGVILMIIFFAIIWRDLTRSNHYRRELEKSKLYAEDLLVAREKLMLTITHDIKAPAGSILGYIDLMLRLVNDKRQRFYLDSMKHSAQHLIDLVTSLLDYHRLEAGKMDLQTLSFGPLQLFTNIYTSFLPLAEKKGLELHLKEQLSPTLTLTGDPFRIRQIAENLLSNALKFTSSGSITLSLDYRNNRLTFSVADTGCGMTEQERKHIFQEFTRLRSAQGQEGFGLGLTITHKLVNLLKGSIETESEPGRGSRFTVSLPLPLASDIAAPETTITQPFAGRSLRILIIDDDRIQLNLTEALLNTLLAPRDKDIRGNKPEIVCCEQPEQVFHAIQQQAFDLLFTDIQMPAMNGFELLQSLRYMNIPYAKTVPVVAITARGDLSEADFRAKGFAGMLQKPFSLSDLRRILSDVLPPSDEPLPAPPRTTAGIKEEPSPYVPKADATQGFDFSSLTAFAEGDPEAICEIIQTFILETEKNIFHIRLALKEGDMTVLTATAHKMLPTFAMIKADKALPALRSLENKRSETHLGETEKEEAQTLLQAAAEVIGEARSQLKV